MVELLEEFDLLPLIKSSVARDVRGQQYKVALTAMFAADPELWLFDELASGIDPLGLSAFRRLARDAARRGRTVIYSTSCWSWLNRFPTESASSTAASCTPSTRCSISARRAMRARSGAGGLVRSTA